MIEGLCLHITWYNYSSHLQAFAFSCSGLIYLKIKDEIHHMLMIVSMKITASD